MSDYPGRGPESDPKNGKHWTAENVRAELPDVPIRLPDGQEASGGVLGRRGKFASVTLPNGGSVEVAWPTLAHVLNSGGAVVV